MLDTETRRRIDMARDILVGKVPDPKSQVEQITIALIYKFMDDMDAKAEEYGGERQFFADEFAQYGWAGLMHGGLSGHDVLDLYATAISRMPENPGIPPLFRDIFSNAYLPYRDPETLRAFLKVIDEFTYDHGERLGDAFEYLLSVLGSQGDAGQFRTPRHIIDFIVAIIDPKKDETILDPACGTGGFLISSWKHIYKSNTDERGNNTLSPGERERLAENLSGYDISPDMVRLSLVNMYLHGLAQPRIHEYDTLTSDDRWNEYADVILANPPFMSPKGGIRPHNRFSVQSKRSEVLFVDYMAEHLSPEGRAGIIVPEGIIFQSQNAYRQLRRMLVEDYLVAVISLPAGVFNPYSGVKTSILILDRKLAKQTDHIVFYRVENDGFDLGAQRRETEKNDLPIVRDELYRYLEQSRAGETANAPESEPTDIVAEKGVTYETEPLQSSLGLVVKKEKIAADGEYNLVGERYREFKKLYSTYPNVSLGSVAVVFAGNPAPQGPEYFTEGEYPFIRTSDIGAIHRSVSFSSAADKVNRKAIDELRLRESPPGTILFPKSGASIYLNHRVLIDQAAYISSHLAGIVCSNNKVLPQFVYHMLCQIDARDIVAEQAYPSLRLKDIEGIQIPLPPLRVQQEIVAEIEGYQRVIDGARAVIDNYRPRFEVDPEWPMVELGKICERIQYGLSTKLNSASKGYRTFRMNELVEGKCVDTGKMKSAVVSAEVFEKHRLMKGDILFNRTNSFEHVGRTGIFDLPGLYSFASYLIRLSVTLKMADPFYVNAYMNTKDFQTGIKRYASRAIGQSNINARSLAAYPIPLPPVSMQRHIVEEIETEQALVYANRDLMVRMTKRIESVIDRV